MEAALFYTFALITLAGAIATVTLRNPVHSALGLILSLLGVAGLFLLSAAEFLFAVQILVYIGGVMVLFLFVIMLIHLEQAAKIRQYSRLWPVGAVGVAAVFLEVSLFVRAGVPNLPPPQPPPAIVDGNTERIADTLLYNFTLPFEAASILLLVAIVGAVWMAKKKEVTE